MFTSTSSAQGSRTPAIVAAVSLALALAGLASLSGYAISAGGKGDAPAQWPAASRIARDGARPTLILFAHPRCPCTRASLGELESLLTQTADPLEAQVWFLQPEGAAADWPVAELWKRAGAIPGVTVHADSGGREMQRFQAETSGDTVLYDRTGRLLFHGGITLFRGHAGENPGSRAVLALLGGRPPARTATPVFGCPLFHTPALPCRR